MIVEAFDCGDFDTMHKGIALAESFKADSRARPIRSALGIADGVALTAEDESVYRSATSASCVVVGFGGWCGAHGLFIGWFVMQPRPPRRPRNLTRNQRAPPLLPAVRHRGGPYHFSQLLGFATIRCRCVSCRGGSLHIPLVGERRIYIYIYNTYIYLSLSTLGLRVFVGTAPAR